MKGTGQFSPLRIITTVVAGSLALLIGFGGGYYVAGEQAEAQTASYELVNEVRGLLAAHYLGELPPEAVLQEGMVEGLLATLDDPYTTYLTPASHELESQTLEGQYGGIGALLSQTDGAYVLIPYEHGPAARAGILEGDLLQSVDDWPITGDLPAAEVTAALRGEAGTAVKVAVAREGSPQQLTFEIEREEIPLPSVTSYAHPQYATIGVIVVSNFADGTVAETRDAIAGLVARGAKSIVLDLRGNPGGLIEASIDFADLFLKEGIIMTEASKDGNQRRHRAEDSPTDVELPLAVLVDGHTASSAEVLAAALHQHGRARLFGSSTFGKGSVQAIYPLRNGASLHITTARWYAPDGSQIDGKGIVPDTIVEKAVEGQDTALHLASQWLQQELEIQQ